MKSLKNKYCKFVLLIHVLFCFQKGFSQYNDNTVTGNRNLVTNGNNNIITVIEGSQIKQYNRTDEKERKALLSYLKSILGTSTKIDKILDNTEITNKLLNTVIEKSNDPEILNKDEFAKILDTYISENKKLKEENNIYQRQNTDSNFVKILVEGAIKLENFDNVGYQKLLEDYKKGEYKKIFIAKKEIGYASYLQATSSKNDFSLSKALLQINEALEMDNKNIIFLLVKGDILSSLEKHSESINFYRLMLPLIKDSMDFGLAYNNLGTAYRNYEKYDSAIIYLEKSMSINEKSQDLNPIRMAIVYDNLSLAYLGLELYNEAILYCKKSIAIFQMALDFHRPDIAVAYNTLGGIYNRINQGKNSLIYYKKASLIFEEQYGTNHPLVGTSYNNMGAAYSNYLTKGHFDSALYYYDKAFRIYSLFDKNSAIYITRVQTLFNNFADVYSGLNDTSKAITYLNKVIELGNKSSTYNSGILNAYRRFAVIYLKSKNYKKAIEYGKKAIETSEIFNGHLNLQTSNVYLLLANIYILSMDYTNASKYYKLAMIYYNANPSVSNEKVKYIQEKIKILKQNHHIKSLLALQPLLPSDWCKLSRGRSTSCASVVDVNSTTRGCAPPTYSKINYLTNKSESNRL